MPFVLSNRAGEDIEVVFWQYLRKEREKYLFDSIG
jgi:hypothetical protein